MSKIAISDEQLAELDYERFHHPHPRVQRKMEAIFLRGKGLTIAEVCRLVGISPNTFRNYLADFEAGGVEGLKRFEAGGKVSELDRYTDEIVDSLVENPVRTLAEARQRIRELTGIVRSIEQVRQFMHRVGFTPRKVGSMPAQADPEVQAQFKKNSLIPA